MSDNQRDFYRIQDRLLMAWRFVEAEAVTESESALSTVNRELEEELLELHDESPETARVFTLLNRKIELLMSYGQEESDKPTNLGGFCDKALVDVSLSGSGMGYFSATSAEEGSYVEVILSLESIDVEITVRMIIIETRISADAENPGFWLRGRFLEDQDKQVDAVVAHVNQRQFEQLQRRAKANGTPIEDTDED
ncbi:MAG TPA: hypothetical protein DD655_04585 [Halieaceae bacterium]|nr:hypothetical protein [Halieaceae bacterium]